MGEIHAVTGAFGFSGSYIARRLLDAGHDVRTLTSHPDESHPLAGRIDVAPLAFDDPSALEASLRGVSVLYNTYWVRFEHAGRTFDSAVANTLGLFAAAERAGVRRIVHVSITNPAEDSPLPYFRGKALIERALATSSISYAILRPAVLFGPGDVLVNNIAWILRRSPVFGLPGGGSYGLRPIFVDDLAALAVRAGAGSENITLDAVGPQQMDFRSMVLLLRRVVGSRAAVVALPPAVALLASRAFGAVLGDVVLTRDEVAGLRAGLLESDAPTTGNTRLTDWLTANADDVGRRYSSELARHFR
jgi:NADH dehydrogenase